MTESIVALLIPITISLGAFMMVCVTPLLENKENMAMIERGLDPKKRRPPIRPAPCATP